MGDLAREVIGVFKGFAESALEFKADVVVPYHGEFKPVLGSFLLVAVSTGEYLLGRVVRFHPMGVMTGAEADDYLSRLARSGRSVPEDIKESKLRYAASVKLLGGLTVDPSGQIEYRASIRELPHLGALVAIPGDDAIRFIASLGVEQGEKPAVLGHLAMGDLVYNGEDSQPTFPVPFDARRLAGRRTYVFAHAGYGKSNLVKHLITQLYRENRDVGFLIFDPEGEYAFTDKKGRPGLVDVPELQDKIVVYTDRSVPAKYRRFVGGDTHFDLGTLAPGTIIANCIVPEKWENVWANALRGLQEHEWDRLVDELNQTGYRTDPAVIQELVHNPERTLPQSVLNNIVPLVKKLHRGNSRLIEGILWNLEKGHIVIVDISLLSSIHGRWVSSLILTEILHRNQANFMAGSEGELLHVVAVVEEAQTVLSGKREAGENIFVEWAKEGRKYGLGAIFVTQQPGAISGELLSQGDNFFVFHLLSAQDLLTLKSANAHFSDDVLASLLNEPIAGNAYFWSAPYQPFVLPMRVLNFEDYAKKRIAEQTEKVVKTASEEFAGLVPDLDKEVDAAILETLGADRSVPVYTNLATAEGSLDQRVAVKLWNLKFAAAEALSDETARICTSELPDGRKVLADRTLYESLNRLKISHRILESDGSAYLVMAAESVKLNKGARQDRILFGNVDKDSGRSRSD